MLLNKPIWQQGGLESGRFVCPLCGHEVDPHMDNFCWYCGAALARNRTEQEDMLDTFLKHEVIIKTYDEANHHVYEVVETKHYNIFSVGSKYYFDLDGNFLYRE